MKRAFLAANPWCHESGCGAASTHVDHKVPVSERPELLMEVSNWAPHCARCSGRQGGRLGAQRARERRGPKPVDPYDPRNW
jgi:hypothetical protein